MTEIVRATLKRVSAVATLPAIALEILRIAQDQTATSEELHKVLGSDPALAARVLKVVNSAFYGRPRQVGSTYAAIQLLGVNAIRNIAVASSVTRMFRTGQSVMGFDAASLWAHSVAVGAAAYRLADACRRVPPDEAFLAGLLHDIGVLMAAQAWLPEFATVVAVTDADATLAFRDAEVQIIGADHQQFGQALCEQWHFPPTFGLVCGHHHEPMALAVGDQLLPALVHVADVLSARAHIGYTRTVESLEIAADVLAVLGLSENDLGPIELMLKEDCTQAMAMFSA